MSFHHPCEVKSRLAAFGIAAALFAACSPSSPGEGDDAGSHETASSRASASSGSSAASGSPGASAYNDLKGTVKISAAGVDANISGAMVGTFENTTTQWNGEGSSDLAASGGIPTAMTVTGTLPSGDTGALTINLAHITMKPAAGTFNCHEIDAYQLNIVFQLFPKGSTTAVKEWAPDDNSMSSCSMTLETPTMVNETTSDGLSYPVYLAHGSLTATLKDIGFAGTQSDGTSGQLSLTW